MLTIDIAYISRQKSTRLTLTLDNGATVRQALSQSQLFAIHPELDLNALSLGIFSQKASLDTALNDGDRIEIYRPLTVSPMEKRRLLAKKRRS